MTRDPLIEAILAKLPEPGKEWPQAERDAWLALLTMSLSVIYGR
jgi:hypothetical protein